MGKFKALRMVLAAGVMGAALLGSSLTSAYAEEAQQPASEAQIQELKIDLPYAYYSKNYGFGIMCPKQPVGVVKASDFFQDVSRQGEVLIFDNEEYKVTYGWVILKDAFSDNVPDFNALNEEQAGEQLKKVMGSNPYQGVSLINLSKTNKALLGITAKEVEIDEDGDGVFDAIVTADSQEAVLFFRGEDGGHYCLRLIDNPELRTDSLNTFIVGAMSFVPKFTK